MSRRETAAHYLLEHWLALLAAGFVVLLDQLGIDWWLQRHEAGASEWLRTGDVGVPLPPSASFGALVLVAALALAGGLGLWRRAARTRAVAGAPCGAASELLVLAGALAMALNVALRGHALVPLTLEPLGWPIGPALLVALPAAAWLGVEAARGALVAARAR